VEEQRALVSVTTPTIGRAGEVGSVIASTAELKRGRAEITVTRLREADPFGKARTILVQIG
jgi:hypothetical protein